MIGILFDIVLYLIFSKYDKDGSRDAVFIPFEGMDYDPQADPHNSSGSFEGDTAFPDDFGEF